MAQGLDMPVQLSQTRPAALCSSTRMHPTQGRQAGAFVAVVTNTAGGLVGFDTDAPQAGPGAPVTDRRPAPSSQSSPTRQAALCTASGTWPEFFPLTISPIPPATPRPCDPSQPFSLTLSGLSHTFAMLFFRLS